MLLLTVATENTDGFKRYLRSAEVNGLKGKVIGMGEEWEGGDMDYPGGGHKINLVKKELEEFKDRDDLILMFTDAYDVLMLADKETILAKFKSFDARVVFSAENFCWPDDKLAVKYPPVTDKEKRFLNSGGFIGYAKEIYQIFHHTDVDDKDDDQLYYTTIFLESRTAYDIKLDTKSEIFHNLNGASAEIEMKFDEDNKPYLVNNVFQTQPAVVHANGPTKGMFFRRERFVVIILLFF